MSFTLGIDIDGVLADFQSHWANLYDEWFGVKVDRKKLTGWEAWKDVTHFTTEAELWTWVNHVPQFWESMPTIPGAMGALYQFSAQDGHRPQLITSRHPMTRSNTIEWVKRNLPNTNVLPELHFVASELKGTIDVQVYIDDSPKVIEALREKPCVLLFDQPWNRDVETGGSVHRVRGWREVRDFLRRLENPEIVTEAETDA